jgi:GNAT superfamily N-acetyltransferase
MMAEFKRATTSDAETLLVLMREFYAHEGLAFDQIIARRALLGILQNEAYGRVFLIESGGELAGYCVLTLGYSLEFRGVDAIVDELYLRAAYRGRGLGKEALEFLAACCAELGVQAMHLVVERANTRAQAVYRQFGFVDHDRYMMTKWLEPDSR